jgi:hypothetical protein
MNMLPCAPPTSPNQPHHHRGRPPPLCQGAFLGGFIGDRAARRLPDSGRIFTAQASVASGIPLTWLLLKGVWVWVWTGWCTGATGFGGSAERAEGEEGKQGLNLCVCVCV